LTSLEPCSSYLACRAQAKQARARARLLARSAPGRKQQRPSRATQAPGPWKQARFPNRPTIESMPRGYGHDQVAFCTWQAPICSLWDSQSPLLVHFMSIRTALFFLLGFFFLLRWVSSPTPNPPPLRTPLFQVYICGHKLHPIGIKFGRVRSYLLGDRFCGVLSFIIIIIIIIIILL
jgi:hypothetical protein